MRIAHFIHRYPPALGGSEAYFARLSRYLAAKGDEVTVFTSNALDLTAFWSRHGQCLPSGETVEERIAVRRYPLWRWPGRRYLLKALSFVPNRRWQCLTLPCNPLSWSMWRDAKHHSAQFDLVHASAFPYAFPILCALKMARRLNVPFFLTPFLHLGDPNNPSDPIRRAYTSPPLQFLLRSADTLFVQTPGERQALLDLGIPQSQIILQGLGVASEECTGGERLLTRSQWGINEATVVVGHLANNSEEKGTVDLLRAAETLWDKGRNFRVVLAGPEMPNFVCFWKTYRHIKKVLRLGKLAENQKRDFFAALDIFTLPSRSDSFGLVLLEAWANGLPNIAYRAGGIADVIRHDKDGLLVRCGDVAGLAVVLEQLVSDKGLRQRLGQGGKQRINVDFNWQGKLELVRSTYLRKAQFHDHQSADHSSGNYPVRQP